MKSNRKVLIALVAVVLFSFEAIAQNITIRGNVKEEATSEAVIGANVIVKNTTTGTITDLDGNFELSVPSTGTLVVKYIGYSDVEIPINGKKSFTIVLKESVVALNEVVAIGYGQVKKSDATGSVSAIDAEKINKGLATSATDLLVGQSAGVSVTTGGGAPGAGATIRIRGGSSMSASNDPLFVIDGVPVDNDGIKGVANPLSTIHPNDIETFTVLKDASATAIYGSRASNGVVLVTTKKGKAGKVKVSYDGNFSTSVNTSKVKVMGANDFRSFITNFWGADSNPAKALGTANTDWQKEIFRTAFGTDHNVSVTGAVPNMPYRLSVAYTNQNGVLKTSNLDRTTVSLSLTPSLFDDHLKINFNAKGMYIANSFADTWAVGAAAEFDPTQPVYAKGEYGNGYFVSLGKSGKPIDIGLGNPLQILEEKSTRSNAWRALVSGAIDYKFHFLPDLRANLNLAYDGSKSDETVAVAPNSSMSYVSGTMKNGTGQFDTEKQNKTNMLLDFYLNYAKEFGINRLDVMAGYSWQHFKRDGNTNYLKYLGRDGKYDVSKDTWKDPTAYATESYLVSFFGRINYTLADKYLLTATLRNDGSSRFSESKRWGLFPSVAAAWKISEESFMKNQDVMSDFKLRLGYGITGQQNISSNDYPYMANYSYSDSGHGYPFGSTIYQYVRPDGYDANLKWEETTTYNVGIDYGFLRNRITGTIDAYLRETNDLINTVPVAAGTNFTNELLTNVGNLENKGIEFSITGRPIVTKDWNWEISYNIAYNHTKLTKLTLNDDPNYLGVLHRDISGATGNKLQIHSVGYAPSQFFVFQQVYDVNGKPIDGEYVDRNGDGQLTEEDKYRYKKPAPDVIMGLNSRLSYKKWDLNFSLRANIGNYVYNNVQSNREAMNTTFDSSGFLKNHMSSTLDTGFKTPQYLSDYYVQNASFVRMDNISLGYNFDKFFTNKLRGRVFATAQNVFTITKYKGLDPEVHGVSGNILDGVDNNLYPRPLVFLVGLNLNF